MAIQHQEWVDFVRNDFENGGGCECDATEACIDAAGGACSVTHNVSSVRKSNRRPANKAMAFRFVSEQSSHVHQSIAIMLVRNVRVRVFAPE